MTYRIQAIATVEGKWVGAGSDELVDGVQLAVQALGRGADDNETGLHAFVYLHTRFGPPLGRDEGKNLGSWLLTTPDPDVLLTISPSGSSLALCVGYLARPSLREEAGKTRREWVKKVQQWFACQNPTAFTVDDKGVWNWTEAGAQLFWEWQCDPKRMEAAEAVAEIGRHPRTPDAATWKTTGTPVQRRVNEALTKALRALRYPAWIRDVAIDVLGHKGRTHRPSGFAKTLRCVGTGGTP